MDRELYMAALRVVARLTDGKDFSPNDVALVRQNARDYEADLPLDVLCCEIIKRELGKGKRSRVKRR